MWKNMLVVGLALFCALVTITLAYDTGYERAKHKYCDHGESSITATRQPDGTFKQSKPVRTGC